jgi:hypothetical protein
VLDEVRVVRTGGSKNLLEVLFGWSGALFEITLDCHHELLVGVLDLFPNIRLSSCLKPCQLIVSNESFQGCLPVAHFRQPSARVKVP